MPSVDTTVPSQQWQLSADGHRAARALTLPSPHYLVASEEPKAIQTLAWAGHVTTEARFNEVARNTDETATDWHVIRRRYVAGEQFSDWEPHAEAARRFDAALSSHLDTAVSSGRHLVVATHGMVLTVWLVNRRLITAPAAFWHGLRLPEKLTIDLDEMTVRRETDP